MPDTLPQPAPPDTYPMPGYAWHLVRHPDAGDWSTEDVQVGDVVLPGTVQPCSERGTASWVQEPTEGSQGAVCGRCRETLTDEEPESPAPAL